MPPKKCCCCFSLKTGSKIIGFWSMIGTPFYIYGITSLNHKIIYIISYITPIGTASGGIGTNYFTTAWQNIGNTLLALTIFKALYFLSSILLLVGLFKNNPRIMMPWLILEPIRQFIYFAFAACCIWISVNVFGLSTVNSNSPLIAIPISVGIAAVIFMGLAFYYWRIVKAVRDEMHERIKLLPYQWNTFLDGFTRI